MEKEQMEEHQRNASHLPVQLKNLTSINRSFAGQSATISVFKENSS
jgi:hypothetical protein